MQTEDFVGFTFDGIHSSDLKLFRVNDGSGRYQMNTVPTFSDKTVQVGGRDGTYFFGSQYSKRDFSINCAFDSVTEEEFRKIQNWGADNKIHKLVFDEWPYKYYNVKWTSAPQLKFMCFDERESRWRKDQIPDADARARIYKGELSLKLTSYEPFARGTIKSKAEIQKTVPDYIKIYLDKDADDLVEVPIQGLEGVDEVKIYLNPDIYARDSQGNIPVDGALGQWDPGTNQGSTSYFAYQPQRVNLIQSKGGSNISLQSNYQTYLYPITFEKAYCGSIDTKTGVTNGTLIGLKDALYSGHLDQKRTEVVQYDPYLRVTYGESSDKGTSQEYGLYRIEDGKAIEVEATEIDNIAAWESDGLKIKNPDKRIVYQHVFEDKQELDKYINGAYKTESANWDSEEMKKYFVVKAADNIKITSQSHSIYLKPEGTSNFYRMEIRYNYKDNNTYDKITVDIDLTNYATDLISEGSYAAFSQSQKFGNSNEWAYTLNLPSTKPTWKWNGKEGTLDFTNPSDIDMPFIVQIPFHGIEINHFSLSVKDTDKKLETSVVTKIGEDVGILIDTELRIIRGYTIDKDHNLIPNENVYNRYITKGDFFYIPSGKVTLEGSFTESYFGPPYLKYEYRYF